MPARPRSTIVVGEKTKGAYNFLGGVGTASDRAHASIKKGELPSASDVSTLLQGYKYTHDLYAYNEKTYGKNSIQAKDAIAAFAAATSAVRDVHAFTTTRTGAQLMAGAPESLVNVMRGVGSVSSTMDSLLIPTPSNYASLMRLAFSRVVSNISTSETGASIDASQIVGGLGERVVIEDAAQYFATWAGGVEGVGRSSLTALEQLNYDALSTWANSPTVARSALTASSYSMDTALDAAFADTASAAAVESAVVIPEVTALSLAAGLAIPVAALLAFRYFSAPSTLSTRLEHHTDVSVENNAIAAWNKHMGALAAANGKTYTPNTELVRSPNDIKDPFIRNKVMAIMNDGTGYSYMSGDSAVNMSTGSSRLSVDGTWNNHARDIITMLSRDLSASGAVYTREHPEALDNVRQYVSQPVDAQQPWTRTGPWDIDDQRLSYSVINRLVKKAISDHVVGYTENPTTQQEKARNIELIHRLYDGVKPEDVRTAETSGPPSGPSWLTYSTANEVIRAGRQQESFDRINAIPTPPPVQPASTHTVSGTSTSVTSTTSTSTTTTATVTTPTTTAPTTTAPTVYRPGTRTSTPTPVTIPTGSGGSYHPAPTPITPTVSPTVAPTVAPTATVAPIVVPTPAVAPTVVPTPTVAPTVVPTPAVVPTAVPTPTVAPAVVPPIAPITRPVRPITPALTTNDMGDSVFNPRPPIPFPRRLAVTPATARALFPFASAVYDDMYGYKTQMTRFNPQWFGSVITGTLCMCAASRTSVIVSFRGTTNKREMAVDLMLAGGLNAPGTSIPTELAVDMHSGFLSAYMRLRPNVAAYISNNQGKQVYFTGHSLGGAMASIAATDFKGSVCCTFGAPRISGRAVVEEIARRQEQGAGVVYRLFNLKDLVSYIPRLNGYTPLKNTFEISTGVFKSPEATPYILPHNMSLASHGRDEYYRSLHRGVARDTTLLFNRQQHDYDFDVFLTGREDQSGASGKRKRGGL